MSDVRSGSCGRALSIRLVLVLVVVCLGASCGAVGGSPPTTPEPQEGLQEINGTRLYYKAVGAGDPLFVLHGGPGVSHRYLLPHMAELADTHRLIFYDQRGTGASDGDLEITALTTEQYVEDLEALRAALGFEKIALMGHSWGAALAMLYASAHPERVERLILIAPGPMNAQGRSEVDKAFGERLTPEQRQAIDEACGQTQAERTPESIAECYRANDQIAFYDPSKTSALDYTVEENTAKNELTVRSLLMRDLQGDQELEAKVKAISAPTLIVQGDYDIFPLSTAEHVQGLIPSSELVVIPEAGHFPFVEQPEAFFAAVRAFLAS